MPVFTHAGFTPYSVKDFRERPPIFPVGIMMSKWYNENGAGLKEME
jgi:hypothetical protein